MNRELNRRDISLTDYNMIKEVLPAFLAKENPQFVNFLKVYYEFLENYKGTQLLDEIVRSRDISDLDPELLELLEDELLLGTQYFGGFKDKRKALKFSYNLYKSKGSLYSIQQFFKMFYDVIPEVEYTKNNVFIIGSLHDHEKEDKDYTIFTNHKYVIRQAYEELIEAYANADDSTLIQSTGSPWVNFLFEDKQDADGIRGDLVGVDIWYKKSLLESYKIFNEWYKIQEASPYHRNIVNNLFYSSGNDFTYLHDELNQDNSNFDFRPKTHTTVQGSKIGYGTEKYITDDKLYQELALFIKSSVPLSVWEDVYKLFVHPAGMYIGASVQIIEQANYNLNNLMPEVEEDNRINVYNEIDAAAIPTYDLTYLIPNVDNTDKIRVSIQDVTGNMSNITLEQLNQTYNTLEEMIQSQSPTMDNDLESGIDDQAITMDQDWQILDTMDEVDYRSYET